MNIIEWNMPWLLLLALQPLLISLIRKYFEQKHISSYVSKSLQPWVIVKNTASKNTSFVRNIAYYFAWLLFAIAAAGPRISEDVTNNIDSNGQDIMVVLDISQSMHATDLTPDRFHVAYNKIKYLIDHSANSRIGIVVYAAKPHLYVPLTHDKEALNFYLKNLKRLVPPSQGSRPLAALKLASTLLTDSDLPNNNRTASILLITDADSDEGVNIELKEANSFFIKNNTPIFTLVTASNQGEAIPAFNDGWLNIEGRPVISRPKPESYQTLSALTNGRFQKTSVDNTDIDLILKDIKGLPNTNSAATTQKNWRELFYVFLLPAILFLFVSMFPYTFKIRALFTTKSASIPITLMTMGLIITLLTSTPVTANQAADLRTAYSELIKKDYIKSRELYSSINNFDGKFGEAISSYRLADYPSAIRLFEKAVLLASTPQHFTTTLYNLGNSYFQTGNYALAVSSYENALLYQPDHDPSTKNLAYAKKALLAIEQRKKLLATTNRAGKGPRSARAAKDIVFSDNNTVSLDNSESAKPDNSLNSADNDIDIPEFIILRGLEFAEASESNKLRSGVQAINQTNVNLNIKQLNAVLDDQSILWRRIFEIEEGYPAPLDEPQTLQGVRPW